MAKLNPSSVYLSPADIKALVALATFCELYASRGSGMQEKRGSVSALVRDLAQLPEERWPEFKRLLDLQKEPK